LAASGTTVDAPLVPLQEVLMDSALQRDTGAELFVVFLTAFVIVFASLAIYFTLAMRPVLLAALVVFLPVAHAVSVWTPMQRVQVRTWSLAFAVLLSDAAILTMFAVTNTVVGQPTGVDRLIFGSFGLLLAALAPAALARIIGAPELQTAVQGMSRGSKAAAVGAGVVAVKGALVASRAEQGIRGGGPSAGGGVPPAGRGPSGGPGGPSGGSTGSPSSAAATPAPRSAGSSAPGGASPAGGWQGALTRPAAGART
ncbi:MAG: hypothetical protein WDZ26_04595, partial [Nitriliruptoraceae bacterium]